MLKYGLVASIVLLMMTTSSAQIHFLNPSFEDDSLEAPCYGCTPTGWHACNYLQSIFDSTAETLFPFSSNLMYPSDGYFFSNLAYYDSLAEGSAFQVLACSLRYGRTYRFSLDYMTGLNNDASFNGHSHLQVIGSNDSCQIGEILFEQHDTIVTWHAITVTLTPTQDWSIIWLKQKSSIGEYYGSFIDSFSPITCLNYNEVQALLNDTSIANGACITLNAQPLGAYDSAYWKTSDGTIVSNALVDVSVCPVVSTDYIACMRSTNCGNFWSYDTVRVEIPTSVSSTKPFNVSLTPTVNCVSQPFHFTTNQACALQIVDVNGKSIWQRNFNVGEHNFKLGDQLPDGVYFYRVVSHQAVVAGKLVLNRCN